MGIKSLFGFGQARDKPVRNYSNGEYSFNFGRSTSGKSVNEMTAMQTTAVYACVRILSEAVASLPIHVYRYKDGGKEMVCDHPLYTLLHDEPNPEMTSFVFRETLMSHLLIWGNAYAQIIRNGKGEVLSLYPLLPNKMSVERDSNGVLYYVYSRYTDENPNMKKMGDVIVGRVPVRTKVSPSKRLPRSVLTASVRTPYSFKRSAITLASSLAKYSTRASAVIPPISLIAEKSSALASNSASRVRILRAISSAATSPT